MRTITDRTLAAVREEREYQDKLWGDCESAGQHTVAEYLVYIQDYLTECFHVISRTADELAVPQTLHGLRKIAAMCVAGYLLATGGVK